MDLMRGGGSEVPASSYATVLISNPPSCSLIWVSRCVANWLLIILEPHIISQVHLGTMLKKKVSEVCPSTLTNKPKWMETSLQ